MDQYTAIEIAKRDMRDIGKSTEDYYLDFATVIGSAAERAAKLITLKASNQHYYLIDYAKYRGLQIESDTGYFNADDYTNNTVQKFTGEIKISQLSGKTWSLEVGFTPFISLFPIEFIVVTIF